MSDLFPSFFESRKAHLPPAKVDKAAKVLNPAPQTLAALATLAAEEGRFGAGERVSNAQPATLVLAAHSEVAGPHSGSWQARAIALEQAGLPHEWAEPFARLLCGAPPRGFESASWASIVEGASIFAEQWAARAFALGWTADGIFGLDDRAPAARQDTKGVAWFLGEGCRVVALDGAGADIETARGVRQRFYRMSNATTSPAKESEAA